MMRSVTGLIVFLIALSLVASAKKLVYNPKEDFKESIKHMRHVQYCEILSDRHKYGWNQLFNFTAYNSFLYGCPMDKWNEITESYIRNMDNSVFVKLNGPRHWLFDTVTQTSTLVDPRVTFVNDIPMVVVGIVESDWYEILSNLLVPSMRLYNEREVRRATEYIFYADHPVYYLQNHHNNRTYAMQSYSTQRYNVTKDNLHLLGSLLTLPEGWSYNVVTVKQNFHLKAINAIGVIVNDNFNNVYSRFDYSILEAAMQEPTAIPNVAMNSATIEANIAMKTTSEEL